MLPERLSLNSRACQNQNWTRWHSDSFSVYLCCNKSPSSRDVFHMQEKLLLQKNMSCIRRINVASTDAMLLWQLFMAYFCLYSDKFFSWSKGMKKWWHHPQMNDFLSTVTHSMCCCPDASGCKMWSMIFWCVEKSCNPWVDITSMGKPVVNTKMVSVLDRYDI